MAGTITHYYFAKDLYKKMDKSTKKKIKYYQNTLNIFSQGPDILFFTINIINNKTKHIGSYIHRNRMQELFTNIIKYIKNNNLQNDPETLAFLYGFIAHYSLDTTLHPYVNYKSGRFEKKEKETHKNVSKHNIIEYYIDAYFINKKEHIKPQKYKVYKYAFNAKISKTLSKLIDNAFNKTYLFKHTSILFKEGIFNMKLLYRIMRYDPYRIKKRIYALIDKITPKHWMRFTPISYACELNNNAYYLNLEHKTWCHPRYNNKVSNDSVLDLYNKALDKALQLIKDINKVLYQNKTLEDLYLNLSMTSGVDCNDKKRNIYFDENTEKKSYL